MRNDHLQRSVVLLSLLHQGNGRKTKTQVELAKLVYMKLPISHPFVQAMLQAEKLEKESGIVTDEVLKIRSEMKLQYPNYFKEYLAAKAKRKPPDAKETTGRWVSIGPTREFGVSRSWSRRRERLKTTVDEKKEPRHS